MLGFADPMISDKRSEIADPNSDKRCEISYVDEIRDDGEESGDLGHYQASVSGTTLYTRFRLQ